MNGTLRTYALRKANTLSRYAGRGQGEGLGLTNRLARLRARLGRLRVHFAEGSCDRRLGDGLDVEGDDVGRADLDALAVHVALVDVAGVHQSFSIHHVEDAFIAVGDADFAADAV